MHDWALPFAYKDYKNDFGFLLELCKSLPIHLRNVQLLMTEIYKAKCSLNPPCMKDVFMKRNISYSLRHGDDALMPKVRTTSVGVESITYLGNRLWQHVPLR